MGDTFVISDLHSGDGSHRDTFNTRPGRKQELFAFIDYVKSCDGKLVVLGDLFELYQMNFGSVLEYNLSLLDKLNELPGIYMLGNHDADLGVMTFASGFKLHPYFKKLRHASEHFEYDTLLIHGHAQDPYCCSSYPNIDRISAIYAGVKKDRNGGAFYGSRTVESVAGGRFGRWSRLYRRCTFQPSYEVMQRRRVLDYFNGMCEIPLLYGHTHEPGQFTHNGKSLPIFNCGSWVEDTCTFARIDSDGVSLWDWEGEYFHRNRTMLPV